MIECCTLITCLNRMLTRHKIDECNIVDETREYIPGENYKAALFIYT